MAKKPTKAPPVRKASKTPKTTKARIEDTPMAPVVDIKDELVRDATPKAPPVRAAAMFEQHPPIPNVFKLTARAWRLLQDNWKVFGLIILLYAAMNIVLIQGLMVSSNLTGLHDVLKQGQTSGFGHFVDNLSLTTTLIGASGSSVAPTAGPYQFIMAVLVSLAVIWCARELFAKREISVRSAFYQSTYPLVAFLLTGLLVIIQLLPLGIGSAIYSIVVANGIATDVFLEIVFLLLFLVLAGVSLYLLCSSVFALYIVTLPDLTPWAAARTARDLVAHRRFTIMRKLLWLPLILIVACVAVMLPFVWLIPAAAPWAFIVVTSVMLIYGHLYMYTLYRSLI
jgi:hypothetical protein